MKSTYWILLGAVGLGAVVVIGIALHRESPLRPTPGADRSANIPRPKDADRLYAANPKAAAPKYKEFVDKYEKAKDPVIQDQVGTARLKLGFLAAHQKDWPAARQAFVQAEKQTNGTGRSGDFGTVNEQGAYEAIVCLEATGKKDEAKQQYTDFIRTRPLSPLCMACYRRLKRLDGGTTPELDKMIEVATKKQDENAKFESSVCGPKTIEHLIDAGFIKTGGQPHDYKAIAKLCHTTETGTTVAGMIDGLKALGISASAYQISRQDLSKLKTPAIVLWGDHYLTVLKVEDRSVLAYDTRTRSEQSFSIPEAGDPDFYLNTILLTLPGKDPSRGAK